MNKRSKKSWTTIILFEHHGYLVNTVITLSLPCKISGNKRPTNGSGRSVWPPNLDKNVSRIYGICYCRKAPFGVYHLSNENSCSWYQFAKEILKDTEVEVLPVDSTQFPQKAQRPQYSVMDLSKTEALGFKIPTWQEALAQMLENVQQ